MEISHRSSNEARKRVRRSNLLRHTIAPLAAVAVVAAGGAKIEAMHNAGEQQLQVPNFYQPHKLVDIGDQITTPEGKKITIKSIWDIAENSGLNPEAAQQMLLKQLPEGQSAGDVQYGEQFMLPDNANIGREVIIE